MTNKSFVKYKNSFNRKSTLLSRDSRQITYFKQDSREEMNDNDKYINIQPFNDIGTTHKEELYYKLIKEYGDISVNRNISVEKFKVANFDPELIPQKNVYELTDFIKEASSDKKLVRTKTLKRDIRVHNYDDNHWIIVRNYTQVSGGNKLFFAESL